MEIIGRQSSHYTRLVRIFAEESALSYRFTPIFDLMSHDSSMFAGNPALKLPILRSGNEFIYGSLNICRVLARATDNNNVRVVWPEDADSPLLMNANEILAHGMSTQVEVVMHEIVERRPPDNTSRKRRQSLVASLEWLDRHLGDIHASLPDNDLSIFEIGLFCLVSHLPFRNPVDLSGMPRLRAFEQKFGERGSARATPYRFDKADNDTEDTAVRTPAESCN